ncbi:MAG: dTMP kinase [Tissierellia bacterium]|nr:dTMP kinase [Tissierellia bacterium]
MQGKFIVFEGSDGSGKTTVISKLIQKFKKENIDIISLREPGGTAISEKIREILLNVDNDKLSYKAECLLFAASRAQLVDEVIKPKLKENKLILCDRFILSSLLYQGIGRNLGINKVRDINEFATGGLKPDLTIFLDIDAKTSLKRKRANFVSDRLEMEEDSFHWAIYEGYKKLANLYKDQICTIDATRELDMVVDDCYKKIKEYIGD